MEDNLCSAGCTNRSSMTLPLMDCAVVELGTAFSVIAPWHEPLGPRDGHGIWKCPMEAYVLRIWSLEPFGGWPAVGDWRPVKVFLPLVPGWVSLLPDLLPEQTPYVPATGPFLFPWVEIPLTAGARRNVFSFSLFQSDVSS